MLSGLRLAMHWRRIPFGSTANGGAVLSVKCRSTFQAQCDVIRENAVAISNQSCMLKCIESNFDWDNAGRCFPNPTVCWRVEFPRPIYPRHLQCLDLKPSPLVTRFGAPGLAAVVRHIVVPPEVCSTRPTYIRSQTIKRRCFYAWGAVTL